jgi:exonuclease VII large subunit
VGSVAVDDVRAQLREAEADLTLDVVRGPMSRPRDVAKALGQEAAGAQVVALTRGVGQDVHVLDEEVIEAVASSPVPILAALGHATDDLVLARVADARFPTPTALGVWLRETVEAKRVQVRLAEEARLLTESRDLLTRLDRLQEAQQAAARWRTVAFALAALSVGLALWLLLRG